jgi:hypothetical protein
LRVETKLVVRSSIDVELGKRVATHSCLYSANEILIDVDQPIRVFATPSVAQWAARFADRLVLALPPSQTTAVPDESGDAVFSGAPAAELSIDDLPDRTFFVDDFRSLALDRAATAHPAIGAISFSSPPSSSFASSSSVPSVSSSSSFPAPSSSRERWMVWRYVAPRVVTHIHISSLSLLLQSAAKSLSASHETSTGKHNSTNNPSSLRLRLCAWNHLSDAFDTVVEISLDSSASSHHRPPPYQQHQQQSFHLSGKSEPATVAPPPSGFDALTKVHVVAPRVFAEKWKLEWIGFPAEGILFAI